MIRLKHDSPGQSNPKVAFLKQTLSFWIVFEGRFTYDSEETKNILGTVRMLQLRQHSPQNLLKSMGRYMEFCIRLKGRQWHLGALSIETLLEPIGTLWKVWVHVLIWHLRFATWTCYQWFQKHWIFVFHQLFKTWVSKLLENNPKTSMILGCFSEGVHLDFCTS